MCERTAKLNPANDVCMYNYLHIKCSIEIGLRNYNLPILGKKSKEKRISQIATGITPTNISCHTVLSRGTSAIPNLSGGGGGGEGGKRKLHLNLLTQ